jgi:CheY-like chemotaxis protein
MDTNERQTRILVVDDDRDVRTLCRINLRAAGFHVIEAAGGREAIETVQAEAPEAVILDVMMPVVDGLQVLDTIRQDPARQDLPVVLISALVGQEDQVNGFEHGADAYVTKPFFPYDLAKTVGAVLEAGVDGRREHRERRLRELASA